MGLLDDAIREHLELKRRRGADPDEVARQEDEALGDPRSGEFAKPDAAPSRTASRPRARAGPPSPCRSRRSRCRRSPSPSPSPSRVAPEPVRSPSRGGARAGARARDDAPWLRGRRAPRPPGGQPTAEFTPPDVEPEPEVVRPDEEPGPTRTCSRRRPTSSRRRRSTTGSGSSRSRRATSTSTARPRPSPCPPGATRCSTSSRRPAAGQPARGRARRRRRRRRGRCTRSRARRSCRRRPTCRRRRAGADYRNRIWMTGGEIPFAGHPSLGVAAAVARARGESSVTYTQETGAGLQPIDVEVADGVTHASMLQEPAVFGPELDPAEVLGAVGLAGRRRPPRAAVPAGLDGPRARARARPGRGRAGARAARRRAHRRAARPARRGLPVPRRGRPDDGIATRALVLRPGRRARGPRDRLGRRPAVRLPREQRAGTRAADDRPRASQMGRAVAPRRASSRASGCASAATSSSCSTAPSSWTPDRASGAAGFNAGPVRPIGETRAGGLPGTGEARHARLALPTRPRRTRRRGTISCPGTPAPPRLRSRERAVEARGIEPLTPACKAGVFPLAPRPRCATKGSAATPAPVASCPQRRGKGGVAAVPG